MTATDGGPRDGFSPGVRIFGVLALAALPVLLAASAADDRRFPRQELPPGVTAETVMEGRSVYLGNGLCDVCHGRRGEGVTLAGSSLRDTSWYHTDGSYESIVRRVRQGITAQASATDIPMPPRGGSEIDDEELRAAAAYVWWLSRGGDPGGPGPRP